MPLASAPSNPDRGAPQSREVRTGGKAWKLGSSSKAGKIGGLEPATAGRPAEPAKVSETPAPDKAASSHVGRVTTRASVAEDSDFILELYASTSADELASLGWTLDSHRTFVIMQAQTQEWNRARLYPGLDRLTICVDGVPAGRIIISITDTVLYVVDLSLLPSFRGRGIGTQLLGEIMVEARAARVPLKVKLRKDSKAVHFFERLGFASPVNAGSLRELTWMPPLAAVGPDTRDEPFVRGGGARVHRDATLDENR